VGTGQFVSVASTLPDRVRWTREQAGKAGDQETLEALDDLATVPADHLLLATASLTNKYAMYPSDLDYAKHVRDFANSGGTDAAAWNAGAAFTGPQLLPTLLGLDLRAIGIEMPVPFFVIQGRDDHVMPPEPVATYVDDVKAPAKAFVLIDGGHYACFTRAGQFVAALREKVRPLVS
jgi:pimeloyl-ACP methyl ester carboxylesterase